MQILTQVLSYPAHPGMAAAERQQVRIIARIDYIYSRVEARSRKQRRQRLHEHARLAKAVAHVEFVSGAAAAS